MKNELNVNIAYSSLGRKRWRFFMLLVFGLLLLCFLVSLYIGVSFAQQCGDGIVDQNVDLNTCPNSIKLLLSTHRSQTITPEYEYISSYNYVNGTSYPHVGKYTIDNWNATGDLFIKYNFSQYLTGGCNELWNGGPSAEYEFEYEYVASYKNGTHYKYTTYKSESHPIDWTRYPLDSNGSCDLSSPQNHFISPEGCLHAQMFSGVNDWVFPDMGPSWPLYSVYMRVVLRKIPNIYTEECDDGNQYNTDTCNNNCELTSCGDGIVQTLNGYGISETCDLGTGNVLTGAGGCHSVDCKWIPPRCSLSAYPISIESGSSVAIMVDYPDDPIVLNGISYPVIISDLDFGDGNTGQVMNTDYIYNNAGIYTISFDVTSAGNTVICSENISVFSCGDGNIDPGEQCEGTDNSTCPQPGYQVCDSCQCIGTPSLCGNSVIDEGEECDDGNTNNNDACTNTCQLASCGDGFTQSYTSNSFAGNTKITCAGVCNNGSACDVNTDCLSGICYLWNNLGINKDGYCSNDPNIQCSVASQDIDCGVGNICVTAKMICSGKGVGTFSSGSSSINGCVGDDGSLGSPNGICQKKLGETPSNCSDCVITSIQNYSEECDDGNTNNNDACTNTCQLASCGDGILYLGYEECDDGNTNNNDACTNTCQLASCGDGILHLGYEECDGGSFCDTSCQCLSGYISDGNGGCVSSVNCVTGYGAFGAVMEKIVTYRLGGISIADSNGDGVADRVVGGVGRSPLPHASAFFPAVALFYRGQQNTSAVRGMIWGYSGLSTSDLGLSLEQFLDFDNDTDPDFLFSAFYDEGQSGKESARSFFGYETEICSG